MDKNDPRSFDYERHYNKEPINIKKLIIIIIIDVVISMILYVTFNKFACILLFNFIYFIICLKQVLILFIKIYQMVAPISIRSKCRFEPSCSNYMLQCLEKYGLYKGLKKGIKRIKRCNINDGGYDYP